MTTKKRIKPLKKKLVTKKIKKMKTVIFIIAILLFVYVQNKVQILLSTCIIPNCLYYL